jgi:hypothetical protein
VLSLIERHLYGIAVLLNASGSYKKNEVCKEVKGAVEKEARYSCPHCDKVLGFGFFVEGAATRRP